MKYTGSSDAAGQTQTRAGTKKFAALMRSRWGFVDLGGYANRPMRGTNFLSVHATGRAIDLGIPAGRQNDQKWVSSIFDWLVANYEVLGVEEVHQYWFKKWGRGFRCERKELRGKAGVKEWSADDNGGSAGGRWLHVELAPAPSGFADDPAALVRAWKAVSSSAPEAFKG